jgi:hypothetical protein
METPLHAQKVAILSRLVKESSLTFEEALLLLKEEEQEKPADQDITVQPMGLGGTWTTPYYGSTITNVPNISFSTSSPVSGTSVSTTSTAIDLNS